MDKEKIIYLEDYKKYKLTKEKTTNEAKSNKTARDEEERIKTLNLFMKVIATMYKESYK
ncbi:hypothetical protein [Alkaliphilus transvaalensis]|uniref:hypothetical protein n=1 Tax=Alkaliphilus transvaalensis TaxID=114628 RepID=UPI0012EB6207|nr:hypothetical protein [Alkaliphilus transvaalensis]